MNIENSRGHSLKSTNRPYASSTPSGSAMRRYEYYVALAREKALSGDRIEAENCYQHAEHYFRSAAALSEKKANQQ